MLRILQHSQNGSSQIVSREHQTCLLQNILLPKNFNYPLVTLPCMDWKAGRKESRKEGKEKGHTVARNTENASKTFNITSSLHP